MNVARDEPEGVRHPQTLRQPPVGRGVEVGRGEARQDETRAGLAGVDAGKGPHEDLGPLVARERPEAEGEAVLGSEAQLSTQPLRSGLGGRQLAGSKFGSTANFAWAVHDGDVGTTAPIPEPSTMLLFGTGLAGLAVWRYRKTAIA